MADNMFNQTFDVSENTDRDVTGSDAVAQFDEDLTPEVHVRAMPSKPAGMPAKTVLAIAISATLTVVVAGGLAYRTWKQFSPPQARTAMPAPRLAMAPTARRVATTAVPSSPSMAMPTLAPASATVSEPTPQPATPLPSPAEANPSTVAMTAVAPIPAETPDATNGVPAPAVAMTAVAPIPAETPEATNGVPAPAAPAPIATPLPPPTVTFEQGTIPPALVTALADISTRIDKMDKTLKALEERIPDSAESKVILQKLHSLEHENALLAASNRKLYRENYRLLHLLEHLRAKEDALHQKLIALKIVKPRLSPLNGWTVAGVGPTAAVLTGPNGAMKLVRRNTVLNGVRILSMRPSDGEVITSDGVLRTATQ